MTAPDTSSAQQAGDAFSQSYFVHFAQPALLSVIAIGGVLMLGLAIRSFTGNGRPARLRTSVRLAAVVPPDSSFGARSKVRPGKIAKFATRSPNSSAGKTDSAADRK